MKKRCVFAVCFLLPFLFLFSSCAVITGDPTGSDGAEDDTQKEPTPDTTVYEIGHDLQVLWDDSIVEPLMTTAFLTVNHPTKKGPVLPLDSPWENASRVYFNIVEIPREDGTSFYRMYYKSVTSSPMSGIDRKTISAVESEDGIHWTRPDYGLFSFNGNDHTNIVMMNEYGFDNFFVFYDTNPDCPAEERFKAVSEYLDPSDYAKLWGYTSPDGLHWTAAFRIRHRGQGTFDSLNTCFYNENDGLYYLYYRGFHGDVRDVRVATAETFQGLKACQDAQELVYADPYDFALYTNNVQPYYRAPKVWIGLPTRYNDHGCVWTPNMDYLPDLESRTASYKDGPRYATTVTDALFMTSRDGKNFKRFTSAWFTPGAERDGTWTYGDGYFAYGMIETPSGNKNQANEISLYLSEDGNLCRYTVRIDGFASYKAFSQDEHVVMTKLFTMPDADKFLLNFATSGAGSVVVDFLDENGNAIEGYTSYTIFGDQVDREVTFGDADLSALEGQTVRLRFTMRDAELFSFKFE